MRLWDVGLGCEAGLLRGHQGPVYKVLFTRDGSRVVSGGWDHDVRVWDVATRRCEWVLRGLDYDSVHALTVSADGSTVAAMSMGRMNVPVQVVVWDTGTGEAVRTHEVESAFGDDVRHAVALSPAGDLLAFTDPERGVGLLDPRGGEPRHGWAPRGVSALAFSPGGLLAVGGDRVRLYDSVSVRLVAELPVDGTIRGIEFPDADRMVVRTDTRTELWTVAGDPASTRWWTGRSTRSPRTVGSSPGSTTGTSCWATPPPAAP